MPVQITAYLPIVDAERFQAYAESFGIDKSALANLLIKRELALQRLSVLERYKHSMPISGCKKVTAHIVDPETKAAFAALSEQNQLKAGAAASILFLAELHERWLDRAFGLADSI
ncbi:hypothetical protein [Sphingomonas abietis]|uniref:Uncharacterized protein n=1 Tax=Sphingomonas abietis TaxID=3012344 RepID=A0ABY7NMH2_9SPHN|nr:hypothetical protein [Sphingomonas abietis]WBO22722.1 hypothetical protein PBT88_00770 [Sphingomonas abietis]